jgi:hypothetical protein
MRDIMNRSRRDRFLPPPALRGKKIELEEMHRSEKDPLVWIVTLKINGWPHDIRLWAKDEIDVIKQVKTLQRGASNNVSSSGTQG